MEWDHRLVDSRYDMDNRYLPRVLYLLMSLWSLPHHVFNCVFSHCQLSRETFLFSPHYVSFYRRRKTLYIIHIIVARKRLSLEMGDVQSINSTRVVNPREYTIRRVALKLLSRLDLIISRYLHMRISISLLIQYNAQEIVRV